MRKGLMLVVTLLCIASLMAAMAYTSASINNKADLTISTTEEGILAFNVDNTRVGHKDENAVIVNNNLVLKFNKGDKGMQKGSVYVWDKMFSITNNSADKVEIKAKWQNGTSHKPPVGILIDNGAGIASNQKTIMNWNFNNQVENGWVIEPGQTIWPRVEVKVPNDADLQNWGLHNLYFNAKAVN